MILTQILFCFMSDSSLASYPPAAGVCVLVDSPLTWLTSYILPDFYQRTSHFPSFASVPISHFSVVHTDLPFYALLFCLDVWTCEPAYQTCSTQLDLLVSCFQAAFCSLYLPYIWFYCILFLKKVIFSESCTLHSMEWLLLSNLEIQQLQITVTE